MSASVYLIASPQFHLSEMERFLCDEGLQWNRTTGASQAEEIVESAGRICYLSFGEKQSPRQNSAYILNLIDKGHESVFEHVSWTFLLTGVSRAFTHQLVRHRAGFSFSQLSQQYHDETNADFVRPQLLDDDPKGLQIWLEAVEESRKSYSKLTQLADSIPARLPGHSGKEVQRALRSAARSVLPNATETKIMVTANARALRHFLRVRGSIGGDLEMRAVCTELLKMLQDKAPALFQDFELRIHEDGSPIVVHAEPCLAQTPSKSS